MHNGFIKITALLICVVMLAGCSSSNDDTSSVVKTQSGISSRDTMSLTTSVESSDVLSSALSNESSNVLSSENVSSVGSSGNSSATSSNPAYTSPSAGNAPAGYEKYSGTRDPYYWPFAATSIWNMPIGSNAQLKKANFEQSFCMSIDDEYIVQVAENDPVVEVYSPISFQNRWPGNKLLGTMQVPYDFVLADVVPGNTPNNCATFIMPDGRTIKQLEPCCRVEPGKQIVGWMCKTPIDIYGAGIQGTHYGSGLSAFGGSIRKGELTSNEPIKHALKLNVWAKKYIYYDKSTSKGYTWPADRNDSYAGNASHKNAYGGTDPDLRMGSLLTIPKNITAESLGISTEVGKKLFYALQNYGCYIVDDAAWDCFYWSAESGVRDEVQQKYGFSLHTTRKINNDFYKDSVKLIQSLYIVTNNSPTSIGGGGTPCKPLAPDFE